MIVQPTKTVFLWSVQMYITPHRDSSDPLRTTYILNHLGLPSFQPENTVARTFIRTFMREREEKVNRYV